MHHFFQSSTKQRSCCGGIQEFSARFIGKRYIHGKANWICRIDEDIYGPLEIVPVPAMLHGQQVIQTKCVAYRIVPCFVLTKPDSRRSTVWLNKFWKEPHYRRV